jgi:CBS domain-containing protein
VVVKETAPYKEIIRLLDEYRVNALPVVDGVNHLVGIVSEADLLLKEEFLGQGEAHVVGRRRRRIERAKAKGLVARDVMSSPVVTTTPDADLTGLARVLHDHNVKQVPVTSPQGRVVGIVSRRDLLRIFLRKDEEIRREVVEDIITRTLWLDRSTIVVDVREGVVRLQGQAEQRSVAEWLVELVERVEGVVGVDDRLSWRIDDRAIHPDLLVTHWGIYAPGARPLGEAGRRGETRPREPMASSRLT